LRKTFVEKESIKLAGRNYCKRV